MARAALARLLVETEHCRLVLPRMFDTLREHAVSIFGIAVERSAHIQAIEIEIAALSDKAAMALLQDLRRLRNVRAAHFASAHPPERSPWLFSGRR